MGEGNIDFGAILRKSIKYWYLFVLILAASILVTYYIIKSTHPVYEASAMLLIKDDENSGQLSEENLFNDLGLGVKNKNLENEVRILSSTPTMFDVVRKLGLNYQYYKVESFLERDLYGNAPIRVANWEPKPGYEGLFAYITLDNKGQYKLEMEIEEAPLEFEGEFGKALHLPMGVLTLTKNSNEMVDYQLAIRITSHWQRAKELKESLRVGLLNDESSIVALNVEDFSKMRSVDLLSELIETYNKNTIDSRNQVFKNTIDLINERINLINQELSEVERTVENYKQRNSMIELSSEGTMLMDELSTYNRQIMETDVQLTILESIEEFLVANKERFEFVPTNASLTNLTLSSQLASFNELLRQRDKMRNDLGPEHPDLKLVERQIQNLRSEIIENIRTIKQDLQVSRDSSQGLRDNLEGRIQSLPRRERELIEIERKKSIKENLYLYLLQKREESAISMAVTMPRGIVVEPAEAKPNPVKPHKPQLLLTSLILGLAIPAGIVLLITQLNNKIETEHDLEGITDLTVVGVLTESSSKDAPLVVKENSRSAAAEMFRMLRANLSYILPGEKMQTLLVTSTISGEGKSFISLNLGMTQALAGKRVIILETDLRKPRQGVKVTENGSTTSYGIVNYLIDPECKLEDIIHTTDMHPNLHVIGCGPKPPNPGELIMSDRMRELVKKLRSSYDFILLDSPPIGIVADALQMRDLVDATLLVVRSRYSTRGHVQVLNDVYKNDKLPHPFIVLNAVSLKDYQYGRYGYGYSYIKNSSKNYFEETK